MKKYFLYLLALLLIPISPLFSSELLQGITVQPEQTLHGVKGFEVICSYSFQSIRTAYGKGKQTDTILDKSSFELICIVYENQIGVKPAAGYGHLANSKDEIAFKYAFTNSEVTSTEKSGAQQMFIPYSALGMQQGNHTIAIKAIIRGKDGTGKTYEEQEVQRGITFTKPKTRTFHLTIGHIEVTPLDGSGKSWDNSMFGKEAPDVGVTVLVANTAIWHNEVNDTYMFAVGPYSQNIAFLISEDDTVTLLVEDMDVVLRNDHIATWYIPTGDNQSNTVQQFEGKSPLVKSHNITYRIE